MKRIMFLAISVWLLAVNIKAQYMDYLGTSADSFRVGNDRYFVFKLDSDSNFVEANVNGALKRFAWMDDIQKMRLDSTRHAWNLLGGTANQIPFQYAKDSTQFIVAPSVNKFLYFNNNGSFVWKWAWSPDTTTVVRTSRLISTSYPLSGGGDLSADRTFSLLYNTTNLKTTSNYLNTIQDIATTSSPLFNGTTWTGDVGSNSYASQVTGWKITNAGAADFRYIYVDEMHAKSFIADLEQALAGGQIISKSVAKVAASFTVASSGTFTVESFAGYPNVDVFQSGDYIRLRIFSRSNGSLTIANAWITVSGTASYSNGGKWQTWSYSCLSGSGNTINEGAIALDYGTSSNNWAIIEQTTIDGQWGANSPYWQVLTGNPTSAQTVQLRLGKLTGIYDANLGGQLTGEGLYAPNIYAKGKFWLTATGQDVGTVLNLKANKTTTDSLKTRMSTAETNITQNANAITLKASQTDLNSLTGRVSTAESNITTNAYNITLRVASTDYNGSTIASKINLTDNTVTIDAKHIKISGETTFSSGYDPSSKITAGGAAADVNNYTTTIVGNKIATGIIYSTGWSSTQGTYFDLDNELLSMKTTNSSYVTNLFLTSKLSGYSSGLRMSYAKSGTEKFIIAVGSYQDGSYARYGFSIWDNTNSVWLMNVGYGGVLGTSLTAKIAGWDFDYQKLYSLSSTTGIELSTASTKNITTGFAVWNPSSPKMFIGNSTSYVDWNNATSSTLTIAGDMVSSRYSTNAEFNTGSAMTTNGYSLTSYGLWGRSSSTYNLKLTPTEFDMYYSSTSTGIQLISNNSYRYIVIDNHNVPKFYGVTDTAPSSNLRAGDYYIGTNGTLCIWDGIIWEYYSAN